MATKPLVSVIIPAHNSKATLGMALSSLEQQTIDSWEAIVVDDGSSDGTSSLVAAYDSDRYVLLRNSTPRGAAKARNLAIAHARGDYLAFLDSDDFLFPTYLADSVSRLAGDPRRIVTHNAYFMSASGIDARRLRHLQPIPQTLEKQQTLIVERNFSSILAVFPRALVDEIGDFDTTLERSEDWEFWIRASRAGWFFDHHFEPRALINRAHESQSTRVDLVAAAEDIIISRSIANYPLSPRQKFRLRRRMGDQSPLILRNRAQNLMISGNPRAAARIYWKASMNANSPLSTRIKALALLCAPRTVSRFVNF